VEGLLVPAQEIAEIIGNRRLTNVVLLGALIQRLPVLPLEAIEEALKNHLPERHRKLLPLNFEALQKGAAFARGELKVESLGLVEVAAKTAAPTSV